MSARPATAISTVASFLAVAVAVGQAFATDSSFPKLEELGSTLYAMDQAVGGRRQDQAPYGR